MNRQELGSRGEELACSALKKKGYRIIERNYRCREGEIDIVTKKGQCLVFVEVRSKAGDSFGSPEESVTEAKKRRLVTSALEYLSAHPQPSEEWRIDFVAIEFDAQGKSVLRLDILENALA